MIMKKLCEKCNEKKEDVEWTLNPYLYDMKGIKEYGNYCLDCLSDMRGDI